MRICCHGNKFITCILRIGIIGDILGWELGVCFIPNLNDVVCAEG